jgi:hypothetical protein
VSLCALRGESLLDRLIMSSYLQQRLQQWIQHPEELSADSLCDLRELLARYPYFQTARLLYLKNLYVLGDASFKSELQKSALYIADLSVLFYFIESGRLAVGKHREEQREEAEKAGGPDRTLDLIDRFLSELPEQLGDDLPLPLETNVDYASVLMREEAEPEKTAPLKGQELIDRFIEHSHEGGEECLQGGEENTEDVEEQSEALEEPDSDEQYFTETLAKIYVKQHRYEKALEIIKKLNLKYPKKNAYFADQIRFLEKLIINAKSK